MTDATQPTAGAAPSPTPTPAPAAMATETLSQLLSELASDHEALTARVKALEETNAKLTDFVARLKQGLPTN